MTKLYIILFNYFCKLFYFFSVFSPFCSYYIIPKIQKAKAVF